MIHKITVAFVILGLICVTQALRVNQVQHEDLFGDIGNFFGGLFGGNNGGNNGKGDEKKN